MDSPVAANHDSDSASDVDSEPTSPVVAATTNNNNSFFDADAAMEIEGELEELEEEPPMPICVAAPPPPQQPQQPPVVGTGILATMTNFPPPPPTPVFDAEIADLPDLTINISIERCQVMVDELFNRWYLYMQGFGSMGFMAAYRLFGVDPDEPRCNPETLEERGTQQRGLCIALYERMVNAGGIDEHNEADECGKRLTMTMHVIGRAVEMMIARCNLADTSTANFNAANSSSIKMFKVRIGVNIAGDETAVAALNSFQRLILTVLAKAFRMNLRKHQGYMFKQVLAETPDTGVTYRTHAWKEHMSIEDFVFSCCDKHTDWNMWNDMTAGRGNKDFAVEYINNSPSDFELRGLNSDRHIFSFTNGLYDAREDQMYTYGDATKTIPETFVAAKYFDVPMPVAFDDVGDDVIDFRDIPTPALDSILSYQEFADEAWVPLKHRNKGDGYPGYSVMDWIYVFMGRMIYEVGENDTWQSLMFIKGKAGTGKSTLGKILSYLYDEVDVGVLNNNIERKFGLSGLVDKLFYICYEVKKDFGLDQAEMQSMISGEAIGIATKNKDPRSVTWKTHGVFMGNEYPRWTNNSGSVGRRIVSVLFNKMVTDGDPRLYDKLKAEMGSIIVKINRAYRECAYVYGGDEIWSVLPPYFQEMRERELEANTSALTAFLVYLKYDDAGRTFSFSPGSRVPFADFRIQANIWVAENLGTKQSLALRGDDLHPLSIHGLLKDNHELVGLCVGGGEAGVTGAADAITN